MVVRDRTRNAAGRASGARVRIPPTPLYGFIEKWNHFLNVYKRNSIKERIIVMKKKVLVCLLTGVLAVSLSGCSILSKYMVQQLQNQAPAEPVSAVYTSEPDIDYSTDWTRPTGGEDTVTTPETSEDPGNTTNPGGGAEMLTSSYLSADQEAAMKSLQTDYGKINWGVRYNPGDLEGIVVSVTPYSDPYGSAYLLVAVTNLYDKPMRVSASGFAKGSSGSGIGNVFLYSDGLGSGSTVLSRVYCSEFPTGEIHWDSFEVKESTRSYVYWEADYQGGKTSTECVVDYSIQTTEKASIDQVYVVIVDENGFVLDFGYDMPDEKDTTQFSGEVKLYGSSTKANTMDAAIFANPVK